MTDIDEKTAADGNETAVGEQSLKVIQRFRTYKVRTVRQEKPTDRYLTFDIQNILRKNLPQGFQGLDENRLAHPVFLQMYRFHAAPP